MATRPPDGLWPKTPAKLAGMRTDPPASVARARGPMPDATAALDPPLLPPGVNAVFQGLRVMPVSGESVTPLKANSGVVVLPNRTAPCSRNLATAGPSSFHS